MMDPIIFRDLQTATASELARRYRLRRPLADFLARVRPARRSDLLDEPELTEIATPNEILLLLREPRVSPDPSSLERVTSTTTAVVRGFELAIQEMIDAPPRAAIREGHGELISAEIGKNRTGIRFSSVRLLGYALPELPTLTDRERAKGTTRLASLRDTAVGELWRDERLPISGPQGDAPFRSLSALLNAILYMTRPRFGNELDADGGGVTPSPVAGAGPSPVEPPTERGEEEGECGPGTGFLADLIPELNIAHCCLAHDQCYAEGCTGCDRAECDKEFYGCMLPVAGPAIAALYYNAVAAFGQASFNYCEGRWGLGGTVAVAVGVTVGIIVGIYAGPRWGVAAGAAAAGLSAYLPLLLCKACEAVREWECTAWRERRYRKCKEKKQKREKACAEEEERRKKKCRNWIKLFRWLCRGWTWIVHKVCVAWTYVTYWICVAWTWIVHKFCVAGRWVITALTC